MIIDQIKDFRRVAYGARLWSVWLCGDRERLRMDGCLRMCVIRENS